MVDNPSKRSSGAILAVPSSTAGPISLPTPAGVAVLGSTGSVGTQTLDVLAHLADRFRVVALVAGTHYTLLAEQVQQFKPALIGANPPDTSQPDNDAATITKHPGYVPNPDALLAAATHPDVQIVVVATSGHEAIEPTLAAVDAGKIVAIANKETIVCAGQLVVAHAQRLGHRLRPIDSEHSALWQSLGRSDGHDIDHLILTASGGPFRDLSAAELLSVTPAQALNHPTWDMGAKITIDSATLMNKGLEIIEAHWLFGVPYDRIDVVVHPQSIVHSLVEFVDGSQIAQLSHPDMRLPIQYALTYPEHAVGQTRRLSLAEVGRLDFAHPDPKRFPALTICKAAGEAGNTFPTVLSRADEVAVEAFRDEHISFTQIPELIHRVLERHQPDGPLSLESINAADAWAETTARTLVRSLRESRRGDTMVTRPG